MAAALVFVAAYALVMGLALIPVWISWARGIERGCSIRRERA